MTPLTLIIAASASVLMLCMLAVFQALAPPHSARAKAKLAKRAEKEAAKAQKQRIADETSAKHQKAPSGNRRNGGGGAKRTLGSRLRGRGSDKTPKELEQGSVERVGDGLITPGDPNAPTGTSSDGSITAGEVDENGNDLFELAQRQNTTSGPVRYRKKHEHEELLGWVLPKH